MEVDMSASGYQLMHETQKLEDLRVIPHKPRPNLLNQCRLILLDLIYVKEESVLRILAKAL